MSLSQAELSKYWDTANILRKNLDAAEYKHIVLGLVFLKYVSDAFEDRRKELNKFFSDPKSDKYKSNAKHLQEAMDWHIKIKMSNLEYFSGIASNLYPTQQLIRRLKLGEIT